MHNPVIAKVMILALLTATLAGCATPGNFSESRSISAQCPGGSAFVNVDYGDSYLKVNAVANTQRGGALEFRLRGLPGYEDHLVTISGKAAKDAWISASGSENDRDNKLIVCVPPDLEPDSYYYLVRVEDVGTLDPRVDVRR